jgi:hypothetical protein
MARIFLLAIVIYLIYRLIFDLIIPVVKTAFHIRNQFGNIHQSFRDQGQNQDHPGAAQKNKADSSKKVGDYIDFEEVK